MQLLAMDCLDWLKQQPDNSIDLIFTSPPYESARSYGLDWSIKGEAWVQWALERFRECHRVCRGLTAWVVEGQTRNFQWSGVPALLMADLIRSGVSLRKPPLYRRDGIPGSGGPDWLKNTYEFVICSTKGKLPWSDNTACGHPPKFPPGGQPSHRTRDGRVNQKSPKKRPTDGSITSRAYHPPKLANPGNIIDCGACGGGHLGSKLAHENEAPFPESLVEFFVKSFCPPGGVVLDPFLGSGTTLAVARRLGRDGIGIDLRESQIELSRKRLFEKSISRENSGSDQP